MKVIIFTSTELRHIALSAFINKYFEVLYVFSEEKAFNPGEIYSNTEEKKLLDNWYSLRRTEEQRFFDNEVGFFRNKYSDKISTIEAGFINSNDVFEKTKNLKADAILVFGSSILKKNILSLDIPIINLHLGLSPYYRGSGTNFWPFYNEEIQYVGATVHLISSSIDGGDIIYQNFPKIEKNDNFHSIGCKTIIEGFHMLKQSLIDVENNCLISHKQDLTKGKLYKRTDFTPTHLLKVQKMIERGLIIDFVNNLPTYPHIIK